METIALKIVSTTLQRNLATYDNVYAAACRPFPCLYAVVLFSSVEWRRSLSYSPVNSFFSSVFFKVICFHFPFNLDVNGRLLEYYLGLKF